MVRILCLLVCTAALATASSELQCIAGKSVLNKMNGWGKVASTCPEGYIVTGLHRLKLSNPGHPNAGVSDYVCDDAGCKAWCTGSDCLVISQCCRSPGLHCEPGSLTNGDRPSFCRDSYTPTSLQRVAVIPETGRKLSPHSGAMLHLSNVQTSFECSHASCSLSCDAGGCTSQARCCAVGQDEHDLRCTRGRLVASTHLHWTPQSACPTGYVVVGMDMLNTSSTSHAHGSRLGDFICTNRGCKGLCLGAQGCTLRSRCCAHTLGNYHPHPSIPAPPTYSSEDEAKKRIPVPTIEADLIDPNVVDGDAVVDGDSRTPPSSDASSSSSPPPSSSSDPLPSLPSLPPFPQPSPSVSESKAMAQMRQALKAMTDRMQLLEDQNQLLLAERHNKPISITRVSNNNDLEYIEP